MQWLQARRIYSASPPAGFGAPNRRKRVFVVASYHGDARDVLLSQATPALHLSVKADISLFC